MNIIRFPEKDVSTDRTILSSLFLSRFDLYSMNLKDAVQEAKLEWHKNRRWFRSNDTGEGSFIWVCDQLDIDPAVVRDKLGLRVSELADDDE